MYPLTDRFFFPEFLLFIQFAIFFVTNKENCDALNCHSENTTARRFKKKCTKNIKLLKAKKKN